MRVLVAAASKYGATLEIAEAIARRVEDAGCEVEVGRIDEVGDVFLFDALVLGSGVYAGHWLKPARRFVDDHADEIVGRPTWLFSSGPIGDPPKPDADSAVNLDEIVAKTKAREHKVFDGKLDKSVLGFADRAIVSAVRSAEGDFRDWDEIDAWAREVGAALRTEGGRPGPPLQPRVLATMLRRLALPSSGEDRRSRVRGQVRRGLGSPAFPSARAGASPRFPSFE